MLKFLDLFRPKSVDVPARTPRTLENVRAAPSPSPGLDEELRVERGKFAQEVVKLEKTAFDVRMSLSRATLDIRTRQH